MATKTLEARFEHLSVKDEKEDGSDRVYGKNKVSTIARLEDLTPADHYAQRAPSRPLSLYLAWVRPR